MSPLLVQVNVVEEIVAGSLASWISCHPLGETTSMLPPETSDDDEPASLYESGRPPEHAMVRAVVFTAVIRPSAVLVCG